MSMTLKNKIFNYFVIPPIKEGETPRVVLSPATMGSVVAKELIERQFKKQQKPGIPRGHILHVCFDYDSERVYILNPEEFSKERVDYLLQAAEVRITKDFGGFSSQRPITGSPFKSLRVRSLNSFNHAKKIVGDHYNGKIFKDLPVIEAFLLRMPTTLKHLPNSFENDAYMGGYVGTDIGASVTFVDELDDDGKKRENPIVLLTQSTPFILINTTYTPATEDEPDRKPPSATEKEWVVLSGYRDYLQDTPAANEEKYISDNINNFADLYAIKRYLYLGYPIEEFSPMLINPETVQNLPELFKAIDRIMRAVDSLRQEGYPDAASIPYYMTFKIDESFPFNISSYIDKATGRINTEKQYSNLLVLDYDPSNSYVLMECPIYISSEMCIKILNAKSSPFISKYNASVNKIDIKCEDKVFNDMKHERRQLAKIKSIVKSDIDEDQAKTLDYRAGELAYGASSSNPMVYNVRKISEYFYACDYIKKMCEINKVPFHDFNVIVGPISQILGQGTRGGFMDASMFAKNKIKAPFEITPGVFISPPVIMVNSLDMPHYADQTETLIHEYSHYIYGLKNPNYKMGYTHPKEGEKPDYEHWYNYLTDTNERNAHKQEIKFELGLGKSYDEIIRNKVGGQITTDNYPIALKFKELVYEALEEMEKEEEENELPTTEFK